MFNIYISRAFQWSKECPIWTPWDSTSEMVFPLCEPQMRNFCSQIKWANQLIGAIGFAQAHTMMKICIIGMKTMKAIGFSRYMTIKINYDKNKFKPKFKHKI
jgi:hypothetical protein